MKCYTQLSLYSLLKLIEINCPAAKSFGTPKGSRYFFQLGYGTCYWQHLLVYNNDKKDFPEPLNVSLFVTHFMCEFGFRPPTPMQNVRFGENNLLRPKSTDSSIIGSHNIAWQLLEMFSIQMFSCDIMKHTHLWRDSEVRQKAYYQISANSQNVLLFWKKKLISNIFTTLCRYCF